MQFIHISSVPLFCTQFYYLSLHIQLFVTLPWIFALSRQVLTMWSYLCISSCRQNSGQKCHTNKKELHAAEQKVRYHKTHQCQYRTRGCEQKKWKYFSSCQSSVTAKLKSDRNEEWIFQYYGHKNVDSMHTWKDSAVEGNNFLLVMLTVLNLFKSKLKSHNCKTCFLSVAHNSR